MRTRFIASAIAITLALAASARAQTAAPTADPVATELTGTVLSSGNIMLLVRGDDGQDRSLVVFESTQLPDPRITAGERVKIRYRPIDGERFEAVSLERATSVQSTPAAAAAGEAEGSSSALPAVAVSSLAWLIVALALTIFAAAYFVSVRRHHHGVH